VESRSSLMRCIKETIVLNQTIIFIWLSYDTLPHGEIWS
jgi:hypothetical protein